MNLSDFQKLDHFILTNISIFQFRCEKKLMMVYNVDYRKIFLLLFLLVLFYWLMLPNKEVQSNPKIIIEDTVKNDLGNVLKVSEKV